MSIIVFYMAKFWLRQEKIYMRTPVSMKVETEPGVSGASKQI